MKEFKKLDFPRLREYYTKYPQGYTIYESLLDILEHINEMTDVVNLTLEQWEKIETWVLTELKQYSIDQLQTWLDNGTLEEVINDALFNSKADKTELQSVMDILPVNIKQFESYNTEIDYWDGALEQAFTVSNDVEFPEGTYKFRNDFVLRGWYKSLRGKVNVLGGRVTLLFDNDGLFVEEGSRYITIENLTIKNDSGVGTGIKFGAKDNTSPTLHFIDVKNVNIDGFDQGLSFGENYDGSVSNAILWNCKFEDVRIDRCGVGLITQPTPSMKFGIIFDKVYFNECGKNMIVSSLQADFKSCNFGINNIDSFEIKLNSHINFESCNFECDKVVEGTGIIFQMRARSISFKNSFFIIRGQSTVNVFGVYSTLNSLTFENIRYVSHAENQITNFWSQTQIDTAHNGAIQFLSGTEYMPKPNWSGIYTSRFINKVRNGLMEWNANNNYAINDKGEMALHTQKDIPVVKTNAGLTDFMGNLLDSQYPIKISNNFYIDGGTITIPAGRGLVTLSYNRQKDGLFILGPTPLSGTGPIRKVVRVALSAGVDYDQKDNYVVLKAYEWTGSTWSDTITEPFDVEWIKISQ